MQSVWASNLGSSCHRLLKCWDDRHWTIMQGYAKDLEEMSLDYPSASHVIAKIFLWGKESKRVRGMIGESGIRMCEREPRNKSSMWELEKMPARNQRPQHPALMSILKWMGHI